MRYLLIPFLLSCGQDIGVKETSNCDGRAQGDEESVDAPYDVDGDGYFDAANPDCAATYDAEYLDCDDHEAAIHPGEVEVACNGLDEDCDEVNTPDAADADLDGIDACTDCNDGDATISPTATETACNTVDDDCNALTPDGDDPDGDGYTECEDCNESDINVFPGHAEVYCNGVDDDCDAATPDSSDLDGDASFCDDCDDADPLVSPQVEEDTCDNLVDDNCDGEIDEDCDIDYSDVWTLDQNISYRCAGIGFGIYLVDINFSKLTVYDNASTNAIAFDSGGNQPGNMSGNFSTSTAFDGEHYIAGSCAEDYIIEGEFLDEYTFEATITAGFSGGSCYDCTGQTWTVTGTR